MNDHQPIIDVTPVDHSSSNGAGNPRRAASAHASSQSSSYRQPGWKSSSGDARTTGAPFPPTGASFVYGTTDSAAGSKTAESVVGGFAQIAIGTGLVLIGIPMLMLPGPGLLSIAGGVALAYNGSRKVFG